MFAYLSLLVERGHMDEIHVNFLIVGHTHTSIDQYFSVITKQLYGKFVGSPLSLQYLFNVCQSPLVNKMINLHYDYRAWLAPIINDLHFYGLPHVFVFKRRLNRAVCQHKPYSRSPRLFPVEPNQIPSCNDELQSLSRPLVIEHLSFLGGIESIQDTLSISQNVTTRLLSTDGILFDRIALLKQLIQPLTDIESRVSCEISNMMDLQSEVRYLTSFEDNTTAAHSVIDLTANADESITVAPVFEVLEGSDDDEDIQKQSRMRNSSVASIKQVTADQLTSFSKALAQLNYNECGYLLWLNYDKVDDQWFNSCPVLYDYSIDVSCSISIQTYNKSNLFEFTV